MKKYLALVVCGLLLTGNAAAQGSSEGERMATAVRRAHALMVEGEARAMEQCGTTRFVVPIPVYYFSTKQEATLDGVVSAIEWSGACVEGKRDGPGVLSWRSERPSSSIAPPAPGAVGPTFIATRIAEGRFVKGQRLGMWCVTKYQATSNGQPVPGGPLSGLGCYLSEGHGKPAVPQQFMKQPDGSWQEHVLGQPTGSSLAAGTLEAQSAKLLAAAAAGKTDLQAQVVMQSQVLDDLVRGSKISVALSTAPISLKDKRVAIVLSSKMGNELERFKRERQALIEASAGLRGEAAARRAEFIQFSDPDRLLINILKVVKMHAMEAQPADDLAGLKESGFDYALVVDWKPIMRLDQLGKYIKEPYKPFPAVFGVACGSLGGFLINRDLKVVKQSPAIPFCQSDNTSATGDQAYMWVLAAYFSVYWGKGPDDTGLSVAGLNALLK